MSRHNPDEEKLMAERRQSRRIAKHIQITWESESLCFDGVTSDICPEGVFIITDTLLPPKTVINIKLHFRELPPVECRGEIVWVNRGQISFYPSGFGVQFIDLSGEALIRLLRVYEA